MTAIVEIWRTASPCCSRRNARNQFYISGTFTRERGGPIIVSPPPPDSHPAVFSGSVNGDTMTMTVQLTDTQTLIGTFTLTRGSPGRVLKCVLPLARNGAFFWGDDL
jgi:hypothetical protein